MFSLPLRVALGGSGWPTEELLKALTLAQYERESYEGRLLRVVRLLPDYGRVTKDRWKRSLADPTMPERNFIKLAKALGYKKKHIIDEPYSDERMLRMKQRAKLDIFLVALFGYRIGKSVLDAFNRNVYIIHPVRPLRPEVSYIPEKDRGASVIKRIVEDATDFVPMQVVLIRAEEVINPKDPTIGTAARF